MNLKILLISILLILTCITIQGQDKPLLVFDLENETIDSIINIQYDENLQQAKTNHYIGSFNSNYELLEQVPPSENIFPDSEFTLKRQASLDFDLTNYPLRTSVKFFYMENDTLKDYCSGSMVSRKHVLTAAHCVADFNTNTLRFDSIYICPVYDNGNFNSHFNCSFVKKIYFTRDWEIGGEDIALMELEEPIGETTGWLGIGFNNTENQLNEGIFYKFSYPATSIPQIDPNIYNGDTLYYNYGKIDIVGDDVLGVMNTTGIPGESGSSLIQVKNYEEYTTYGVLSFSNNLTHNRLKNSFYFPVIHIIEKDIVVSNKNPIEDLALNVFPNPTSRTITIEKIGNKERYEIILMDAVGEIISQKSNLNSVFQIDIGNFPNGIYFLKVKTENGIGIRKIIKNGS